MPGAYEHAPLLFLNGTVRALTPAECGILNGFPADFRWGKSAHRLIGNAVPPRFMKAIAEHVRDNVLGASSNRQRVHRLTCHHIEKSRNS